MKKLLLAVLFAFALMPVMVSASITTKDITQFNQLTDVQKAEIAKQIAVTAEKNGELFPTTSVTSIQTEDVEEWVLLGQKMGVMLGGAAKELGIAANEFASTPLGMMTMGLIIWNYAGDDLLGVTLGLLWFLVLIPLWTLFFFKINYKVENYEDVKIVRWGKEVTVSKAIRQISRRDGINGTFIASGLLIIIVGLTLIA